MIVTSKIKLDMAQRGVQGLVSAVQGDGNTRAVEAELLANGSPWKPDADWEAAVTYRKPDGTKGLYNLLDGGSNAITISGSTATVILAAQMMTEPGTVRAAIVFNNKRLDQLTSFPFLVSVARNQFAGAQQKEDYIRLQWLEDKLEERIAQLISTEEAVRAGAAAQEATTAAAAAQEQATTAGNAAASANAAASRAEAAAAGADTAKENADTAANSANTAAAAAQEQATAAGNAAASANAAASRADTAASAANTAAAAAQAVVDGIVPEVEQLRSDLTGITPDDTAVDGKPWTSKQIVDSLCQPFEKTGNPVQCYPVENYPLGVKVQIEPKQEGKGNPSPDNIRPISGKNAISVTMCGKNLFNPFCFPSYTASSGIEFIRNDDGRVILSGASTSTAYCNATQLFGLPKGTYTISPIPKCRLTIRDENLVHIIGTRVGSGATFTLERYTILNIYVAAEGGITFDNEEIYLQIELGSTATAYEPYTGSTNTLTLPETVYGGTLDVSSGVFEVTDEFFILTGNEPIRETSSEHRYYIDIPTKYYKGKDALVCSHYRNKINNENQSIYFVTNTVLSITDSENATSISEYKAYIKAQYDAGTPVQICYKLATPYTIQLSPQQIAALSGVNTIYTDADGVVVTGAEDPRHTITELKNAILSLGGNI